jgi:transcriptional regulator with GAF, ATPase, and Fis domain
MQSAGMPGDAVIAAATGAGAERFGYGDRIGRIKAADRSTVFFDEIGNLPLHLQPKLLTALEQREVVPVGSNRPMAIDVRVVAATNLPAAKIADESRWSITIGPETSGRCATPPNER